MPGRLADLLQDLTPDTKVADVDWAALMQRDEHDALQPPTVTRRGKIQGKPVRRGRNSS